MLHRKQLSSIELGGGIAVGGQVQQNSLARPPLMMAVQTLMSINQVNASIGVWTTTSQVYSQLYNDITSQIWNVGGVVCNLIIAILLPFA